MFNNKYKLLDTPKIENQLLGLSQDKNQLFSALQKENICELHNLRKIICPQKQPLRNYCSVCLLIEAEHGVFGNMALTV